MDPRKYSLLRGRGRGHRALLCGTFALGLLLHAPTPGLAAHRASPDTTRCTPEGRTSVRPSGSLGTVPFLLARARGHGSSPVRRAIYLEVESLAGAWRAVAGRAIV